MSVDIEYPLPGDVIGLSFRAGGDYSSLRMTKDPKGGPPPPSPTPIPRSGWCATPTPLSICSGRSTC